jgi:hypothetical protein
LKSRKYLSTNLLPALRLAARLRNEMVASGFTDNGGAIHSAERIVNILGMHLKYPELTHINGLRKLPYAEKSLAAQASMERGETVVIEHVSPLRALTRQVIEVCSDTTDDALVANFVRENFRLVLLVPDEVRALNRKNRSKMQTNRLELAGIKLWQPTEAGTDGS